MLDAIETKAELAIILTIMLDPPIEVGKVSYDRLDLAEPTLAQVRDAHAKYDDAFLPSVPAEREADLTFVQVVSGRSRALIDELPARVLREAVTFLLAHVSADLPDEEDPAATELTIPLATEITVNGGTISEVALREPKAGELRKAEDQLGLRNPPLPGNQRKYELKLIELVSGLPALAVARLPIGVSKRAVRFLQGFERSARATATK